MGYRINYSELAERIGSGTATFADKLADGVRNFACILWNNFPDQITQNQSLGASFARGVMTAACSTSPPPPSAPFIGGQCDCITYTFSHNYNLNDDPPGTVRTFAADVWGPVEQWRAIAVAVDSVRVQVYCKGVNARKKQEVCSLLGWYSIFTINQLDTQAVIDSITNVQVTRADGQPDNCGDPVSEYPPTAPTVNDYSTTITINQDDGTSLTFPVVYAPVDFNFPLNFDLGGIKITFDLGGIDFNFNETNSSLADKINDISEDLKESFLGAIPLGECYEQEDGTPAYRVREYYPYTGEGLGAVISQIDALSRQLEAVHTEICSPPEKIEYVSIVAAPEVQHQSVERALILDLVRPGSYLKRDETGKKDYSKWRIQIPNPIDDITWDLVKNIVWMRGQYFCRMSITNFAFPIQGYFASKQDANDFFDLAIILTKEQELNRTYNEHVSPRIAPVVQLTQVYRGYVVTLDPATGEPQDLIYLVGNETSS